MSIVSLVSELGRVLVVLVFTIGIATIGYLCTKGLLR